MFSSRQKLQPTPKTIQLLPEAPGNLEPVFCPYSLLIWIFHKLGLMHCMAFGVLASAQGVCKTQRLDVISLVLWIKKNSILSVSYMFLLTLMDNNQLGGF